MKRIVDKTNIDATLRAYAGAIAQIWLFNITHKRLAIRFEFKQSDEVLYIVAVSCEHIAGPFRWSNAQIQIHEQVQENKSVLTIVRDVNVGFELVASSGVALLIGPNGEIDNSFENFLGDAPEFGAADF